MGAASNDNKGSRKVETHFDDDDDDYEDDDEDEEDQIYITEDTTSDFVTSVDDASPGLFSDSGDGWFSLAGGTGLLGGEDFYGFNHLNLSFGGDISEEGRAEFSLGLGWAPVQKTSYLNQSIKDGILIANLSLQYKGFLTPPYTFMGSYFLIGGGYSHLFWKYENSIQADEYDDYGNIIGTDTISNDSLGGLDLFCGLGFNIVQTKNFQLGGELVPGIIVWYWETVQGFDNDVFDPFGYVKFRLVLNFNTSEE